MKLSKQKKGGIQLNRREFLKKTAMIGLGAGVMFIPKGLGRAAAADSPAGYPDLVALKGGGLRSMFDRGMKELGSMGRFVKKGQKVVIKPNMSWDVTDGAANTSPELVAAIVKHCMDAGASGVIVVDHSIEYWENSRRSSGIADAVKSSGAVFAPAEDGGYYQKIAVGGARLQETMIHETLLECDVLISAPVLKHHGGAGVSISAKGLMGCIWDRREYHSKGLQSCIADFLRVRKPDLNVIDADRVITRHGPRGGSPSDVAEMRSLLISPDIVAADTAGSMMLGRKQGEIEHIRLASQAGFGEMDLSRIRIERIAM
jgi:uncharacterized protein (DUF362 family)